MLHCGLTVWYAARSIGWVRAFWFNLYLVVEKGPTVEMGGTYSMPYTPQGLVGDESGLKSVGTATLGYYHRERLFKFNVSIDTTLIGINVRGDIGFDMCPDPFLHHSMKTCPSEV